MTLIHSDSSDGEKKEQYNNTMVAILLSISGKARQGMLIYRKQFMCAQ